MGKVAVWKSEVDGKLFEDKSKYTAHLRKLASNRIYRRKLERMEATRPIMIKKMGQVACANELTQFIRENWQWFWANGAACNTQQRTLPYHDLVDIKIINPRWDENLSNSHCCPRGGVTNFFQSRDSTDPRGYPGWHARLEIEVQPHTNTLAWGSSYFRDTIINTGTGGGGGKKPGSTATSYHYDIKLWAADFPVMYEKLRKQKWIDEENAKIRKMWGALGGTVTVPLIDQVPVDWQLPSPWEQKEI
jgi:hypothetical protein